MYYVIWGAVYLLFASNPCSLTPSTLYLSLPPCLERLVCIDCIGGSHAFGCRMNSAEGGSHRTWEGKRTPIPSSGSSLPEICLGLSWKVTDLINHSPQSSPELFCPFAPQRGG